MHDDTMRSLCTRGEETAIVLGHELKHLFAWQKIHLAAVGEIY